MNFRQRTEELRTFLRRGDMAEICRQANCSITLLRRAFNADLYSDLTQGEKRAYMAFMEMAGRRRAEADRENKAFDKKAQKIVKP